MPVDQAFGLEALRSCALFRGIDEPTLALVAQSLHLRRFRRQEVVFHQGDPGDSLYVIESGRVKIVLPSTEGDEAIIATLQRGDFFGELALLDAAPRSATATAIEPTRALVLTREPFLRLVDTQASLRNALLAALTTELRRLTRHVEELHFLDLGGRLAMRLARLAWEADPTASEVRLGWPYTQSDLAAMIGGTRQSVNRLLGGLVADGLVRFEGDAIVIRDVGKLAAIAER